MTYLFRIFTLVKLNECILQRIARLLVSDYLTAHNRAKAGEDELEILIPRDGVELAHEKYVFGRSDVRKR